MKNPIFSALLLFLFLMANSVLYGQTNQGTIFKLKDTNVHTLAAEVHQFLSLRAEYPGFPNEADLRNYFKKPFETPFVLLDTVSCDPPGLRAYKNGLNQVCIRFDSLTTASNGNLVVGKLDYADPLFPFSYIIHGPVLNAGIDLPVKDLHCQIFVIGFLCPARISGGPQYANKFEILIVDKNIL